MMSVSMCVQCMVSGIRSRVCTMSCVRTVSILCSTCVVKPAYGRVDGWLHGALNIFSMHGGGGCEGPRTKPAPRDDYFLILSHSESLESGPGNWMNWEF